MKTCFSLLLFSLSLVSATAAPKTEVLFDGKTFTGWEGDTNATWRIEQDAITAGSLEKIFPRNEFLCTRQSFTNFVLRFKVRIVGTEGFVNGGVQVRSKRITNPPHEMSGYQADVGEGWWGALYDESRRNKVLAKPENALVQKILKKNDWNDYEVRCQGRRIQIFLNGQQTVDYTEPEEGIEQSGVIGLQIHGDGKTVIAYKDITVERL